LALKAGNIDSHPLCGQRLVIPVSLCRAILGWFWRVILGVFIGFLKSPERDHTHQMNNDEKHAMPIAEKIPAWSEGKIPSVLGDEINSVNQPPSGGKRKASTVKSGVCEKRQEVHSTDYQPAKSKPFLTGARGKA
jgi:hypothetical protein